MAKTVKEIVKECLLQYHNEVIKPKLTELEKYLSQCNSNTDIDIKKLAEKVDSIKKSLTINETADITTSNKINNILKENSKQNNNIDSLGKKLINAEKQIAEANNTASLVKALKLAINELKTNDEELINRLKSVEELQEYYYNKLDRVVDILNMELDKIYGSISTVLPAIPVEDGTYILKVTITDGIPIYVWDKCQ